MVVPTSMDIVPILFTFLCSLISAASNAKGNISGIHANTLVYIDRNINRIYNLKTKTFDIFRNYIHVLTLPIYMHSLSKTFIETVIPRDTMYTETKRKFVAKKYIAILSHHNIYLGVLYPLSEVGTTLLHFSRFYLALKFWY